LASFSPDGAQSHAASCNAGRFCCAQLFQHCLFLECLPVNLASSDELGLQQGSFPQNPENQPEAAAQYCTPPKLQNSNLHDVNSSMTMIVRVIEPLSGSWSEDWVLVTRLHRKRETRRWVVWGSFFQLAAQPRSIGSHV
jgi:hypothetical protein